MCAGTRDGTGARDGRETILTRLLENALEHNPPQSLPENYFMNEPLKFSSHSLK